MNVTVTPMRPSCGRKRLVNSTKDSASTAARMSVMRARTDRRSRCTWWCANICERATTSRNASIISCRVTLGRLETGRRNSVAALATQVSRSSRGRWSMPSAACL